MNEDVILQELLQIISAGSFGVKSAIRKIISTSASSNASAVFFSGLQQVRVASAESGGEIRSVVTNRREFLFRTSILF